MKDWADMIAERILAETVSYDEFDRVKVNEAKLCEMIADALRDTKAQAE